MPWCLLGCHATARTLCMHKVCAVARRCAAGTPWVRSSNAVIAQRGLLERHEDAVRTQRDAYDRGKNATAGGGVCTETPRSIWRRHYVSTASSRRVYGVCTAPKPNNIYSIAPSWRPYRAATAITAITCYHRVLRCLQGVCTALTQRLQWVVSYSLQKRMTHKPLLWKFQTLIEIPLWVYLYV